MEHAGTKREVAVLAWPLAVGMVSFTLMGVVDTLLMGQVSTEAQAGVGLATTLAFAAVAFFRGLVTGAQTLVAAAWGAEDPARVRAAADAGLWIALACGLVAAGLLWFGHAPLLAWAVDDAAVGEAARAYLRVRVAGVPFTLLSFGLLAGLQGTGDTRSRMIVSVVGNALNVALDGALIFGWGWLPALGVEGAAWATVASSACMAGLYGVFFVRRLGWPRALSLDTIRRACAVGVPAGAQNLSGVGAFVVLNLALARTGATHLAASEIVLQIVSVSFLPGVGVGEAGGVLVGRYLGAGRPETAARVVRSARALALVLMGSCGLIFAARGGWLTGWFTQDPEVATLAATLMWFAASFQLFDALAMVNLCALRGAGDTRFTLLLCTAGSWGILVPATLGLGWGLGWGAWGAWCGLTLEVVALAGLSAWRVGGLATGRVGRIELLLGR